MSLPTAIQKMVDYDLFPKFALREKQSSFPSRGPQGKAIMDISGQRFGLLTALEPSGFSKSGDAMWLCKCDCGNTHVVRGSSLRSLQTRSCGCLRAKGRKKEDVFRCQIVALRNEVATLKKQLKELHSAL